MKKELLFLLFMGSLLVGCHSSLKLDNIDPTAQLDMGLARSSMASCLSG